jgi:hypothetical protein
MGRALSLNGILQSVCNGYGLDDPGSIFAARFLSSPQHPHRLLGPSPRRVENQGHIADYSHISSAEVKKGGAIPPLLRSSGHSA